MPQLQVVFFAVLVFSAVLHEVAHAWAADRLGDPTARRLGRITLNPVPHIDLFMTIIVPALFILMGSPPFGGAKPVPINPQNFKNPRAGMAISSIAGPLTNIGLMVSAGILYQFVRPDDPSAPLGPFEAILGSFVIINCVLAGLNLVPIPPLDGSRVVSWLLPRAWADAYNRIGFFGIIIVLVLLRMRLIPLWLILGLVAVVTGIRVDRFF